MMLLSAVCAAAYSVILMVCTYFNVEVTERIPDRRDLKILQFKVKATLKAKNDRLFRGRVSFVCYLELACSNANGNPDAPLETKVLFMVFCFTKAIAGHSNHTYRFLLGDWAESE